MQYTLSDNKFNKDIQSVFRTQLRHNDEAFTRLVNLYNFLV